MPETLRRLIEERRSDAAAIRHETSSIYQTVLEASTYLDGGNFTVIHPNDLERMFDEYDRRYFYGGCRRLATAAGNELRFRLSSRMTSAGGKTFTYRYSDRTVHEIAVSTALLFQTFADVERPVVVSGIACRDRLEALQRIVEHEMIHLAEVLVWKTSSCSAPRFASIAGRFFGHTEMTHKLVTPRERAVTKFGIAPGSRVRFRFEGAEYTGMVHRITKRATVLVENPKGRPYSNGRRYAKFYVPVCQLEAIDG